MTLFGDHVEHEVAHVAMLVLRTPAVLRPTIRIDALRRLEPDNIGSVIGEHLAGKRSGGRDAGYDDANTG